MKKLTILLLLVPIISFSQMTIDTLNQDVYFSKVYDVNKTQKQIHQRAQEWIAINFKDANEVIKLNTPEKIISKGYFNVTFGASPYSTTGKVYFILEVAFKDNKYKLDFNTFVLHPNATLELPVKDYYLSYDLEYYKKILMEQSINPKKTTKTINNPDKLQNLFNKYRVISKQITTDVDNQLISSANSLYEYINKESSTDW